MMFAAAILPLILMTQAPAQAPRAVDQEQKGRIAPLADAVQTVAPDVRLLTDSGVSQNPHLGRVMRVAGMDGRPFITVWPVSKQRLANLPGAGSFTIIGAADLLVGTQPRALRESCEAGAYLIGAQLMSEKPEGALIRVTRDDKGAYRFKEALRFPMEQKRLDPGAPAKPVLSVDFPDKDTVTDRNPAWCVTVEVRQANRLLTLRLDLDITML